MAETYILRPPLSCMTESFEDSAVPQLTSLKTSPSGDTILQIIGSSISMDFNEAEKPGAMLAKPPPLLEDPDKKNKYGYKERHCFFKAFQYISINSLEHCMRQMLVVIIWSAAVVQISTAASSAFSPTERNACRYMCSPIAFDNTIVAYVGLAFSLLLGFRVSEAYGRYERGLQIWNETIASTCSLFASHAGRFFPEDIWHPGDRQRLYGWLAAFPITLKRNLRGEREINELHSVLSDTDIQSLQAAPHMPSYCLEMLSTYILCATDLPTDYPQIYVNRMLTYISALSLSMHQCENIAKYSVNYGYLVHLRLFMGIWIFMLPFSLVQECGWYTVILVPLIAYGIIGTEKIAEELTQPFGYDLNDIPIGLISNQIVENIRSKYMLASTGVSKLIFETETMDPADFLQAHDSFSGHRHVLLSQAGHERAVVQLG